MIAEYYPEITRSIDVIGEPVLLAGHSTGGLIASLYAHEGPHREQVRALWLNSPFFDWNLPDWRRAQLHGRGAGPLLSVPQRSEALLPDYTQALLDQGWEFDTTLKPVPGFPVYYGWLGAIADAHAKVHAGLDLRCPVLAMHSDEADIVLDWRHIARWSRSLGPDVAVMAFPGAMHDVTLSRFEIRDEVFRALFLGRASRDVAGVVFPRHVRWRTEARAPREDNVLSRGGACRESRHRNQTQVGRLGPGCRRSGRDDRRLLLGRLDHAEQNAADDRCGRAEHPRGDLRRPVHQGKRQKRLTELKAINTWERPPSKKAAGTRCPGKKRPAIPWRGPAPTASTRCCRKSSGASTDGAGWHPPGRSVSVQPA